MRSRLPALLASALLVATAAGCSAPAANAAPKQAVILMNDEMRFVPDSFTVKQGDTVTFEVKNVGSLDHELFIGNQAQQDEHETEMRQMGSMMHDHATGVGVVGGQSKTLTLKFSQAGTFLMGCHVPGHWTAGMRGTIVVDPA